MSSKKDLDPSNQKDQTGELPKRLSVKDLQKSLFSGDSRPTPLGIGVGGGSSGSLLSSPDSSKHRLNKAASSPVVPRGRTAPKFNKKTSDGKVAKDEDENEDSSVADDSDDDKDDEDNGDSSEMESFKNSKSFATSPNSMKNNNVMNLAKSLSKEFNASKSSETNTSPNEFTENRRLSLNTAALDRPIIAPGRRKQSVNARKSFLVNRIDEDASQAHMASQIADLENMIRNQNEVIAKMSEQIQKLEAEVEALKQASNS